MKKAYCVSSKSRKVLKNSSSGGVFYSLAYYFIKDLNGIVYGATSKGANVYHTRITRIQDIEKLMKSKYVRGALKNTFEECKNDLISGKNVLFVGLPCQIFSLKTFLDIKQVNCTNLCAIDLICHGVPNQKTLINYLESRFPNEVIKSIDFRVKKPFWEGYFIKIETDQKIYSEYKFNNEYLSDFLNGANLDECCYSCKFKGENRKSSITIGDFWGVKTLYPKFYNNRGTSLLIVHDEVKFLPMLQILKKQMRIHEINFEDAIKFNESYYKPTKKPEKITFNKQKKNINIKAKIKSFFKLLFKRM